MNAELREIIQRFMESGWERIAPPSKQWLEGKCDKDTLVAAIGQAKQECGSCGCALDPLYGRALELLADEPAGFRYGKLVRDRIPEIIRKQGFEPKTRVLDPEEYLAELNRKLREETEEYLADENPEEIADILEVIEAICHAKGFDQEEILRIKLQKREARGAFDQRLYLISKE